MYPVKLEVVGIKSETTQNTAATLTGTDYFLAQDVNVKPVPEFLPRDYKHMSLDKLASIMGQIWVDISYKFEIKGSGTAGTPLAPLSAMLQAAGFSETILAGVSVTYAPISAPAGANFFTIGKSATVEYYEGATLTRTGIKRVIRGCVASGGPKLVMEAGKIGMYEISLRGLYQAPTDALAPAVTYSTIKPPKVQSANFLLHGFAAVISKLELDYGAVISKIDDVNAQDGLKGFAVTDRDPKGSCDPLGELVGTFDFHTKMTTAAEDALSITIGATAGNITSISCPKTQFVGLDPGEREGNRMYQLPLKINQSTGDDSMTIVLT